MYFWSIENNIMVNESTKTLLLYLQTLKKSQDKI